MSKVKITEENIQEMVFQGVKKILEEGINNGVDLSWLSSQNPNLKNELEASKDRRNNPRGEEMDYTFYDLNLYKIIGKDILQYLQQSGSEGLLDLINSHMEMRIIVQYIIEKSDINDDPADSTMHYDSEYYAFYVADENYEPELLKNTDILKTLYKRISDYLSRNMDLVVGDLPQNEYDYFRPDYED